MNRLHKVLITCCLLFQSHLNFADTSKTFEYENQTEEVFNLENFLKKTVMVKEEVKGTCERQIPYQENVCKDVTKYKNECKTVPAHQECRQVNDPICHTETTMETECHTTPSRQQCHNTTNQVCGYETRYENECRTVPGEQQCRVVVRYRQECSQVPGEQQCRTIPGDIQCSIINGENKCVKIPPRQECSQGSSRNECRQVPYEERECSTSPSRQECRQVPRQERVCRDEVQRECETIPGDRVCNQVPRQNQVCEDNYRRVCENVPAQEVCKKVPYTENVCGMETKYKKEQYECMKEIEVPKVTVVKTHRAAVKVEMTALSEILGPSFQVGLDANGAMSLRAQANRAEDSESAKAIGFVKKDVKAQDRGEINDISANYKVVLMDTRKNFAYLDTSSISGSLGKYSLSFNVKGKVEAKRSGLVLKISRKDKVEIDKKVSRGNMSFKYNEKGDYTNVYVNLKAEGAKIGSIFTGSGTTFRVDINFSQDYSDAGEMILSTLNDFNLRLSGEMNLVK